MVLRENGPPLIVFSFVKFVWQPYLSFRYSFHSVKIHPIEKGIQQDVFLKMLFQNFGIKLLKNTCKMNSFFDGEKPYKLWTTLFINTFQYLENTFMGEELKELEKLWEEKTSETWKRGGISDFHLLKTLFAINLKSWKTSFWYVTDSPRQP